MFNEFSVIKTLYALCLTLHIVILKKILLLFYYRGNFYESLVLGQFGCHIRIQQCQNYKNHPELLQRAKLLFAALCYWTNDNPQITIMETILTNFVTLDVNYILLNQFKFVFCLINFMRCHDSNQIKERLNCFITLAVCTMLFGSEWDTKRKPELKVTV